MTWTQLKECVSDGCENDVTSPTSCCICDREVCLDCMTTQLLSICVRCDEGEEDSKPKYAEGLREFESQRGVDWDGAPTYVETIRDWLYTSFITPYYKYCEAGNEITFHCYFSIYEHHNERPDDLKPGITTFIPRHETISERQRNEIIRNCTPSTNFEQILGVSKNKFNWFFVHHFDLDPQYINPDLESSDDRWGDLIEAVKSMLNDVIVRVQSEDSWWSDIEHEVIWYGEWGPYPWVPACWKFTLKM